MLTASIREFGQPEPVLARTANRMLVAGHGVLEAMAAAGETRIIVDFWDVDQETADRYMLASNRLAELGVNDHARMLEILGEMDPDDWAAVGFTPDEVEGLDPHHGLHGEAEIRPVDVSDLELDFLVIVRGPIRRQPEALQKLQKVLAEFPEVSVRLMTEEVQQEGQDEWPS